MASVRRRRRWLMTLGAGTTRRSYLPLGSLGALELAKAAGALPNSAISYGYDAPGRVISRGVGGVSETFQYDLSFHS